MWGRVHLVYLVTKKRKKKEKKEEEIYLGAKTSARNYNIVKSIGQKGEKKKGPVGCKYWVVRKVLKWRWLALLPVRLLLLLFAGGPSQCQATQVCCCCCCRLWWTRDQASGRLLEMGALPAFVWVDMNI